MSTFDFQTVQKAQSLRIFVESSRLSVPDATLNFHLTHEGLGIDMVDREGDVLKSLCLMWDELEGLLQ